MFNFVCMKEELLIISSSEPEAEFILLCKLLLIITRKAIKFIIKTGLSGRNKFPLQNSIWETQNIKFLTDLSIFTPSEWRNWIPWSIS
jgi:hypothetical protein